MSTYLTPDKTFKCNGVTVKEYLLTVHNPNKISMPVKRTEPLAGVTIHNTGIISVSKETTMSEQHTRSTMNGNMNTVRVHYYVDSTEAWHNLPNDYQSWHAGQRGKPEAHGSEVGNRRTISIECIMGGTTGYEKAEDNAARLAAYLLASNNMTVDQLFTHNYWCNVRNGRTGTLDYLNTTNDNYKNCPVYIRPHWFKFKALVDKYIVALGGKHGTGMRSDTSSSSNNNSSSSSLPYLVKVIDTSLNVRKGAGLSNPVACVIKKNEVYTIIEEKQVKNSDGSIATWGKLKSGIGWINVGSKYVTKV